MLRPKKRYFFILFIPHSWVHFIFYIQTECKIEILKKLKQHTTIWPEIRSFASRVFSWFTNWRNAKFFKPKKIQKNIICMNITCLCYAVKKMSPIFNLWAEGDSCNFRFFQIFLSFVFDTVGWGTKSQCFCLPYLST